MLGPLGGFHGTVFSRLCGICGDEQNEWKLRDFGYRTEGTKQKDSEGKTYGANLQTALTYCGLEKKGLGCTLISLCLLAVDQDSKKSVVPDRVWLAHHNVLAVAIRFDDEQQTLAAKHRFTLTKTDIERYEKSKSAGSESDPSK